MNLNVCKLSTVTNVLFQAFNESKKIGQQASFTQKNRSMKGTLIGVSYVFVLFHVNFFLGGQLFQPGVVMEFPKGLPVFQTYKSPRDQDGVSGRFGSP